MTPHLFRLSSVVTKQLFLLPPDLQITTLSICLLAMCTITYDVHNETQLQLSGFLLYPNVCSKVSFVQLFNTHYCVSAGQLYTTDIPFCKYRRQLFHASLVQILSTLKDGMANPVLTRCPDGHFRKIVYGLGPYIADYPEQLLLSSVVQGWCAK